MASRWHRVSLEELETVNTEALLEVWGAGFDICKSVEECDIHPGQPLACYLCL